MSEKDDDLLGEDEKRVAATTQEIAFPVSEAGNDEIGFETADHHFDAFPGQATPIVVDPNDNLPRPADVPYREDNQPLNEDTLVCMEDRRKWVEVFRDETLYVDALRDMAKFLRKDVAPPKHVVEQSTRSRFDKDGVECTRRSFSIDQTVVKWGTRWAVGAAGAILCPVRPVRPKCIHYSRFALIDATIDNAGKPATPMMRFCGAYKSVGGARMSLTDEAIVACESRMPPDPRGIEMLELKDEAKKQQGRERQGVPLVEIEDSKEK